MGWGTARAEMASGDLALLISLSLVGLSVSYFRLCPTLACCPTLCLRLLSSADLTGVTCVCANCTVLDYVAICLTEITPTTEYVWLLGD